MIKIGRVLFHVLAAVMLASCLFAGSGDESPSRANPILQFQSDGEELTLSSLQVGQHVYSDVALKLAREGAWQLKSVGALRPLVFGESAQAVLRTPADAVLNMDWRPADATITIPRMHIDAKVFGNITLRLTGNQWFWGDALQSGNDLQDAHELKALTLADYHANTALAATETHHTVLHSHPAGGTQRFPVRLGAKAYKFCMDRQDEGADSIRLLDSSGKAVVSLTAGDACIDIKLDAGLYTMEYVYGAGGATRTVFVRPAAALPNPPSAKLAALGAQDPAYPEYWAVYVPPNARHSSDGFLSFSQTYADNRPDPIYDTIFDTGVCKGVIDAAAQLQPSSRVGWSPTYHLFSSKNFFLVTRDSKGMPSSLSLPAYCQTNTSGSAQFVASNTMYRFRYTEGLPLVILPDRDVPDDTPPPFTGMLKILGFSGNQFELIFHGQYTEYDDDDDEWEVREVDIYFGFGSGTVTSLISDTVFIGSILAGLNENSRDALQTVSHDIQDLFQVAFRYFPSGLPPSMKDSNGDWILEPGEVALFAGEYCTGAAMIAKHSGVLSPQPSSNIGNLNSALGSFNGSLQLGPNTVATFARTGSSKSLNQSGCMNNQVNLAQQSLEISVTTAINIQTNSCEYCNLAGIDLSNQAISLKGVKLQHTNLTGAQLDHSDLTRADLRHATLQGANLSSANLEAANLCQASLNGRFLPSGMSGDAASLPGAHLKNANLSGANLDGADFTNASFYSSTQQSCQPASCDTYALPVCASAYQASMNNTKYGNAYLANVDMSGVIASSADFSNAVLFGAKFIQANLNNGSSSGTASSFASAFLQGADFTNAGLKSVSFYSAYVDADAANDCMQIKLRNEATGFPGFTSPTASPPVSCVARGDPAKDLTIPSCVSASYAGLVPRPATDSTNTCPDGHKYPGGCTAASWASPSISAENASLPNKTCQARLCNAFTENTCWN